METRGVHKRPHHHRYRADRAARILAGLCLVARTHRVVRCEARPMEDNARIVVD